MSVLLWRSGDFQINFSNTKDPTKCLWRWESDRRYNFFFSPPAHLCRHIYNWNIVACDAKHQYTHSLKHKYVMGRLKSLTREQLVPILELKTAGN